MSNWPKQNPADMNAFYGNPDSNGDGVQDAAFQANHLIRVTPPYPLFYPRAVTPAGEPADLVQLRSLTVNKRCADSLVRCLERIGAEFTAEELDRYQLHICGGVNVFRRMRGGKALSIHSWGCAIDLAHQRNAWKRKYGAVPNMMPQKAVAIFASEGWTWGGKWRTPDAMHFQAADV